MTLVAEIARDSTADAWRSRAADAFPGGVNSPVRAWRAVGGAPPVLIRGKGSIVWDVDGRPYRDFIGAFGPHVLGHAHPAIVRAIREAASAGGPFGSTHPAEVRLGERIRAAMPGIERLRFTSSGTEAAMSAIRLARAVTHRPYILKFAGAYHGHADALLVRAGSGVATLGIPDSAGVDPDSVRHTIVMPYNDLAAVQGAFDAYPREIAAVIVEPVAANMGVVPPDRGFLHGVRDVCDHEDALLIFDEVVTGFRLGAGGAQGRFGIRPDLTLLGKIIGGGLPIGAFGGREDLMRQIAPDGPVYHAGTLAGHPLAMAAGDAALAQLTPSLYRRLERLGGLLERGVREAALRTGATASVVRVGSLLTVFFRPSAPRTYDEATSCDREAFARFHRSLVEQQVLIPPSPFEAWFVSAAHTRDDIDYTVAATWRAFQAAGPSQPPDTRTGD